MKKIVLLASFLVSCNSYASANWNFISANNIGDSFFIDTNSIQISGDSRTFWTLTNFSERDVNGWLSTKNQRTINCRTRESTWRFFMSYDDINNKGKLVSNNVANSGKWEPIAPDTIQWVLMTFICK
jgi:hypothetical protein